MRATDWIFQEKSYKSAVARALGEARFGRGSRTKLARHLGVQPSFISRVLVGDQEFSAEHVVRVAAFLELDSEETDYLILLHHRDRAGGRELRLHYQKQIDRIIERRSLLRNQIDADRRAISDADALRYYGSWYHAAVHMYLRIPGMDLASISAALALPATKVKESIALLEEIGMIVAERGKWKVVDQRIHNDEDSLGLRAHHMNWRQASIRAWDEGGEDDLFYSLVMSTDAAGMKKIRKIVIDAIAAIDPVLGPSEDREVHALALDLFRVGRPK